MKTGVKSVLWSAVALLLLLSIAVPLLNVFTAVVMMVPTAILYTMLSKRAFTLHMLVVYVIAVIVLGPPAIIVGLFFLVPSIVMGHLYQKQTAARKVLTATVLTLLAQMLLELVLFDVLFNMSLLTELRKLIQQTVDNLNSQGLLMNSLSAELTESYIQVLIHSIPMAFITVSFLLAVITHAIVRPILRSMKLSVPGLQPAKDWMLPRIFVFYYLIVLLVDLATPGNNNSFFTVMLLNLVPLMRLAFSIQAMGFFFYIADQRKWNKAVPLLLCAVVVIFPPLSLIGVMDAGFPIRKAFKKP
ncbi:hypothetical protein Back11_47530 [Paenibacillus baekrokdamisoli]|uniref:Uncharacterized protein n=1 Tax=Paenibacillus baekrokdamisoli TaxID=1712516 RepID=A0A3G9JH74_9BACL|nr:DUF2232 domain-containing protein [Paenibacillus baekrokdamisoli]MBB3068574.1 uncharacterized protein YybS (DUF2232 family) [Paenibacillus baekrokdamisoli]BBH23408.1 hypothetical protein Back11_47530 [Paenibacillus baekrokdamisoli]